MSPLCNSLIEAERLNHAETFYPLYAFVREKCFWCSWKSMLVVGYTFMGGAGNTIHKIRMPAGNSLTAIWTCITVQIGSAAIPPQGAQASQGAVYNTRFFYVRSIGCFAWIAGEQR